MPALRLDGAEIALLLSLRSTEAATISRQGLGITAEPGPVGRDCLAERGLWQERHGMGLPAAEAITVGDTLTSAVCWLRIGTAGAVAATIVIGPEHTLLLAALGDGGQEIAALQVDADVAQVAAGICDHLVSLADARTAQDLHVHVLRLDAAGSVHEQIVPAATHSGDSSSHETAGARPGLVEQLRQGLPQVVHS